MLKIAICDDNCIILESYKDSLELLIGAYTKDFRVEGFHSGEALLSSLSDYHLIFLDVEMPNKDGFQVAREIKEHYAHKQEIPTVVFLTSHEEFARQGFKVDAFRYLIKGEEEGELEECIKTFFQEKWNRRPIEVYDHGVLVKLKEDTVIVLNSANYGVEITAGTHIYTSSKSLKEWEDILDPKLFFRCHKEAIVNFNYIFRIEQNLVVLNNGKFVPISRRKRSSLLQTYKQFIYNCTIGSGG